MLCPRCGKETKFGFCKDCLSNLNPIKLKKIEISFCSSCGNYNYKGIPLFENVEEKVKEIVKKKLIVPEIFSLKEVKVSFPKFERKKIVMEIKVIAEIKSSKEEVIQKFEEEIKVKGDMCKNCKELKSYLAILQFRNFMPKIKIKSEFTYKIDKKKEGIDFYITRKEYAREIAKKFRNNKNFDIKETQKLIGIDKKTGKRKSRLTISIRRV